MKDPRHLERDGERVLDDDAQDMLAAFRGAEQIPEAVHGALWERLEASLGADAGTAGASTSSAVPARAKRKKVAAADDDDDAIVVAPWRGRWLVAGLAAAAAIALLWTWGGSVVEGEAQDAARSQASHEASRSSAGGEAIEGHDDGGARPATTMAPRGAMSPKMPPEGTPSDARPLEAPPASPSAADTASTPEADATPTSAPRTKSRTKSRMGATPREPAPAKAASIDEELALLQRARDELLASTPGKALRTLAEHAQRFPRGALAPEREGLRTVARCQAGRDGAQAAAEQFLRKRPGSPLADRVRAACTP